MSDWNDVRFWMQVLTDSHRTVLCPPRIESRVREHVDACGLDGMITVVAEPLIPDDRIVMMDGNALEASWREALQRTVKL